MIREDLQLPEEIAQRIYSALNRGDYSSLTTEDYRLAEELAFSPNLSGSFERWIFLNNIRLI